MINKYEGLESIKDNESFYNNENDISDMLDNLS